MQGDNAMLIWVGKQQCRQTNNPVAQQEFDGSLAEVLDHIKNMEKSKK